MILYPTETIYGLGVNALDDTALKQLFQLKGRDERQTVSWGVRHQKDIEYYAEVSSTAVELIRAFLPGPLTLVLPAKPTVPATRQAPDRTIGFRIPGDALARKIITDFMDTYAAPLTCTSANVSGLPPQPTVPEILEQFGEHADEIETAIDDGPRSGVPSTVVRVVGEEITIHRAGAISEKAIWEAVN